MTTKKTITRAIAFMGMLALSGCTTQLGKFSVYTPETIDLSKGEYRVDKSQKVQGIDETTIFLVIPYPDAPQYDEVVRHAMAKRPDCVGLADVTLTRKAFWLGFGYCDFIAEGYPIVKKEAK